MAVNNNILYSNASGNVGICLGNNNPVCRVSVGVGLGEYTGYGITYCGSPTEVKAGILVCADTGAVNMGALNSSGTWCTTIRSNNFPVATFNDNANTPNLFCRRDFDPTGASPVTCYCKVAEFFGRDVNISSGKLDCGYRVGLVTETYFDEAAFAGTLRQSIGVWARVGVNGSLPTGTICCAISVWAQTLSGSNSTIYNLYGIYQSGVDGTKNYFQHCVGIGTASPCRHLHLSSTAGTFARFTSENSDDFSVGANTNGFVVYNETDGNYPLVVDNTGNVGIGETSPASLLTLKGGNILLEYNSTGADDGHGIFFHTTTNGWSEAASHAAIYGKRVDANNGYLRFDTRSGGTTAERMRITSAGNVSVNDTYNTNFVNNGSNTRYIGVASNNSDALFIAHSSGQGVGYFGYDNSADRLIIATDNGAGGNSIQFSVNAGATSTGAFDNLAAATAVMKIDSAGAVAITPDCMCANDPLGILCLDITGSTNPQNGGLVMDSTSQTHIRFLSGGNLCWQWRHHSPADCDVFSVYSWKRACDMFMIKAPIDTDTGFTSFGPYGHIISCAPLFVGNISNDPYFINNGGNKCIRFYSYCFGTTSCFPQTHFMVRFDSSLTNVCQVYPTATLYNANETEGTSSTLAFAGKEAGGGNSVGLAYISGRKEASVANSWANGSLNFLVNCDGCQCWTTCMTMCGGVCVIKCLVAPIIQMANSDCVLCLATGGSPGAYFQGSADCTISYWGIDSSWKAQINSTGGFCAANCVMSPLNCGTLTCACVYKGCTTGAGGATQLLLERINGADNHYLNVVVNADNNLVTLCSTGTNGGGFCMWCYVDTVCLVADCICSSAMCLIGKAAFENANPFAISNPGVATYDWCFPNNDTVAFRPSTTSTKTLYFCNAGTGVMNVCVEGCLKSPLLCGATCVISPVICGTTCVQSPVICGTGCVKSADCVVGLNVCMGAGWFRNATSGTGLYNAANSLCFFSSSACEWTAKSNSTVSQIQFDGCIAGPTVITTGYIYGDACGCKIGFLNCAHSWSLMVCSNCHVYNPCTTCSNITCGISCVTSPVICATTTMQVGGNDVLTTASSVGANFCAGTDVNNRVVTANGSSGSLCGEANLTFDGSTLNVTGAITASGDITSTSDERVKREIAAICGAIQIVNNLCGRIFIKDNRQQVGVIAQEVEKVLPQVVFEHSNNDLKSVSYGNIVGVLIEAIKDQDKRIDKLEKIIQGIQ